MQTHTLPCQPRRWHWLGQWVMGHLAPHPFPCGWTCSAMERPQSGINTACCCSLWWPARQCVPSAARQPARLHAWPPTGRPASATAPQLAHNVRKGGAVQVVLRPAAPHQLGVGVQTCRPGQTDGAVCKRAPGAAAARGACPQRLLIRSWSAASPPAKLWVSRPGSRSRAGISRRPPPSTRLMICSNGRHSGETARESGQLALQAAPHRCKSPGMLAEANDAHLVGVGLAPGQLQGAQLPEHNSKGKYISCRAGSLPRHHLRRLHGGRGIIKGDRDRVRVRGLAGFQAPLIQTRPAQGVRCRRCEAKRAAAGNAPASGGSVPPGCWNWSSCPES